MIDLLEITDEIKLRHKNSQNFSISGLITKYRAITGYKLAITPMEKNMLKNIFKYCREAGLDFVRFLEAYAGNFDKMIPQLKEELSYMKNEDFKEPTIKLLYQHCVLKYLTNLLTNKKSTSSDDIKEIVDVILNDKVAMVTYITSKNSKVSIVGKDKIRALPPKVKEMIRQYIRKK